MINVKVIHLCEKNFFNHSDVSESPVDLLRSENERLNSETSVLKTVFSTVYCFYRNTDPASYLKHPNKSLHCNLLSLNFLGISTFEVKYGQVKIQTKDEFLCKTQSFGGTPKKFSSSDVHIQLTVSNKDNLGPTYQAAVTWVENIKNSEFTICIRTSGPCCKSSSLGYREIVIQYLAFVGTPSNGLYGTEVLPMWTTGTECKLVPLRKRVSCRNSCKCKKC